MSSLFLPEAPPHRRQTRDERGDEVGSDMPECHSGQRAPPGYYLRGSAQDSLCHEDKLGSLRRQFLRGIGCLCQPKFENLALSCAFRPVLGLEAAYEGGSAL